MVYHILTWWALRSHEQAGLALENMLYQSKKYIIARVRARHYMCFSTEPAESNENRETLHYLYCVSRGKIFACDRQQMEKAHTQAMIWITIVWQAWRHRRSAPPWHGSQSHCCIITALYHHLLWTQTLLEYVEILKTAQAQLQLCHQPQRWGRFKPNYHKWVKVSTLKSPTGSG